MMINERTFFQRSCHTIYFLLRGLTTCLLDFLLERVTKPFVYCPQGVCGVFPLLFPSPPPCGWSTGFITTPRTVGRIPCQRIRPAFPSTRRLRSGLETIPK